jgi:hypothetical protein
VKRSPITSKRKTDALHGLAKDNDIDDDNDSYNDDGDEEAVDIVAGWGLRGRPVA